jgi:hypothetical protein
MEGFYTTRELAVLAGLTPGRIHQLVRTFPGSFLLGHTWVIPAEVADKWLKERDIEKAERMRRIAAGGR